MVDDKDSTQNKQQFWGDRLTEAPEELNIRYCAGRDVASRPMADSVLVPYDCWQNRAHSTMLEQQGIISREKLDQILTGLKEFEELHRSGALPLQADKEDVHTNIEHFVAERHGREISGVMHTGRSRNDQTTTVVRMYVRDQLLQFAEGLGRTVEALVATADKYVNCPIAGFTHYQPGSVTTVGHWFASHAQALLRDIDRAMDSYRRINISPLGAAASFGTSWPIDRKLTSELLGFSGVQENSLDCITNRWEMEADAGSVLAFAMNHLSILSQDLILLSQPAFNIIRIADRYVTGSSIMPQKRNPDFAEVTRSKAALVHGMLNSILGIAKGALSGYNRDTQWTKYLIIDLFDEVQDAPGIFAGVLSTLSVNRDRAIATAEKDFVNAVDVADVLAQESGLPFRVTYEIVSKAVKICEEQGTIDPAVVCKLAEEHGADNLSLDVGTAQKIAERKTHLGAPAAESVRTNLVRITDILKRHQAYVAAEMNRLADLR